MTYIIKIRELSVEDLCVEKYDIFKNLVAEIFLVHSRKFILVKLQYFSNFRVHESLPFYRLSTSVLYFFMRTT